MRWPWYPGPLVADLSGRRADLPGWRALWSASTSRLVEPPIKLSTVGSRAFPVATAQVWNGLSECIRTRVVLSSLNSILRLSIRGWKSRGACMVLKLITVCELLEFLACKCSIRKHNRRYPIPCKMLFQNVNHVRSLLWGQSVDFKVVAQIVYCN